MRHPSCRSSDFSSSLRRMRKQARPTGEELLSLSACAKEASAGIHLIGWSRLSIAAVSGFGKDDRDSPTIRT